MNSEDSNIPAKKTLIFEHLSTKPSLPRKSTRTGLFAVGNFLKRPLTLAAAIVTLVTLSGCSRPSIPWVIHETDCCERIGFVSDREGNKDIYTINTDGSDLVRLTDHPGDDYAPAWSPDGSRIVFLSDRNGIHYSQPFIMNADGSGASLLSAKLGSSPSWSPDGKMMVVAFGRNENPDIYVINADGSGLKRLTDHPAVDVLTSWSPEGTQIAFYSNRDGDDIYVVNVDGTELTRLTHHPATDISPIWSPDSSRIVFVSTRDRTARDLPDKR